MIDMFQCNTSTMTRRGKYIERIFNSLLDIPFEAINLLLNISCIQMFSIYNTKDFR